MTRSHYDCEHVLDLGERKPMGFLPLPYFADYASISLEEAEAEAARRGIQTRRFTQAECGIAGGAVYAWAEAPLCALLGASRAVLEEADWPTNSADFVAKCAVDWVADSHPVRGVIATAFGNAWEIEVFCPPSAPGR
jgi:hypothetical protein